METNKNIENKTERKFKACAKAKRSGFCYCQQGHTQDERNQVAKQINDMVEEKNEILEKGGALCLKNRLTYLRTRIKEIEEKYVNPLKDELKAAISRDEKARLKAELKTLKLDKLLPLENEKKRVFAKRKGVLDASYKVLREMYDLCACYEISVKNMEAVG